MLAANSIARVLPRKQRPLLPQTIGSHNRVCAFFQNREEEYKLLVVATREGLPDRDRHDGRGPKQTIASQSKREPQWERLS